MLEPIDHTPHATICAELADSEVEPLRTDIQAMRALAVSAVLIYHLWPTRLPGGFIGVDVFFVISGFLITSHLIKASPRSLKDVAGFWARRIQRLLPPVVVVILAILAAMVLVLPRTQWQALSREAIASLFYVENWHLIGLSTDYLDAGRAHSPFQHFWSLSVEEQYYIIWPFVIGLLGWLSARVLKSRVVPVYALGFGALVAISLAASVIITVSNPAVAYFSTFTRVWQLGLGSVLAAVYPWLATRIHPLAGFRVGLVYLGLTGVLASALLIKETTSFPGWIAIVPTFSAALVIMGADPDHRLSPRGITNSRPVQFLGDTSYALYLWHWPLLILAPAFVGHDLTRIEKLVVLVLSVVAAGLSTRWIEKPIRQSRSLRLPTRRLFVLGAASSMVVATVSLTLGGLVTRAEQQAGEAVAQSAQRDCFGAAAMVAENGCAPTAPLVTAPEFAKADISIGIKDCLGWPPFEPVTMCTRGTATSPSLRVALLGNSHGGHWLPALEILADKNGWRVDTYLTAVCLPLTAAVPYADPINGVAAADLTPLCQRVSDDVLRSVEATPYDVVVISVMDRTEASTRAGYAATLQRLTAAGKKVVVIRDTPAPMDRHNETPDCVSRYSADPSACNGTPQAWVGVDPVVEGADMIRDPNVRVLDVTHLMCTQSTCPAVIGGVIVYSDYNHLTATFARTVAPHIELELAAFI